MGAIGDGGNVVGGVLHNPRPHFQVIRDLLGALTSFNLGLDGVPPRAVGVRPRVDTERPCPRAVGHEYGVDQVGIAMCRHHGDALNGGGPRRGSRPLHDGCGRNGVVPLAPHDGAEGDDLSDHRLGGYFATGYAGADVVNAESSNGSEPSGHRYLLFVVLRTLSLQQSRGQPRYRAAQNPFLG